MPKTQIRGGQVLDGSIKRKDLNIDNADNAVIRKIIAGTGISISSTGAATGTGDVTISSTTCSNFVQLINDSFISVSSTIPIILTGMQTIINVLPECSVKLTAMIQFSMTSSAEVYFRLYENDTELTDTIFSYNKSNNSNQGNLSTHHFSYLLTNPSVGNTEYSFRWNRIGSGTIYSRKRSFLIELLGG